MKNNLMNSDKKIFEIIKKKSKKVKNDFFFIQIGSNDGVTGDPIHFLIVKNKWKGILIEPIKYLFNRLVKNYNGQKGLIFENVAISRKKELKIFYRMKERKNNIPWWYNQIGSFYKTNVLEHGDRIKNIRKFLIKEKVRCLSLNDILGKYKVKKLDLLHIDAEGYDYEIINSINFKEIVLGMILYEHKHLDTKNKGLCENFLLDKGYSLIKGEKDTLAYQKDY